MRKVSVAFTVAAAILLVSSSAWNADAQTTRGAADIAAQLQDFSPVQQANCGGPGPYCPTGLYRRCGPNGCWCAPCGRRYYRDYGYPGYGYPGYGYPGYGYPGPYRWGWGYRRW